LIVAGAEITRHLYGAILQSEKVYLILFSFVLDLTGNQDSDQRSTACANLKSILGYMAPYFPFKLNGSREIKVTTL
jgi:hypothetical protein